jgi:xylan 1,4-beta-xylosidase
MNVRNQLRNIDNNLKIINAYPELKKLPIIIGESDPEGCAACGMSTNPENAYRNGTMYSSYTAASFARKYELAEKYNAPLTGAVSWSFEFEDQPIFAGFRDLATNGIDKPVLNVFRMFGMMQGKRVAVTASNMYPLQTILDSSVRATSDIGAIASKGEKTAAVMIWNYHDADTAGLTQTILVTVKGLPAGKVKMTQYRIDDQHSNAYTVWKKMGSPLHPTKAQFTVLEKSGQLQKLAGTQVVNSNYSANITLPKQGVSFIKFDW